MTQIPVQNTAAAEFGTTVSVYARKVTNILSANLDDIGLFIDGLAASGATETQILDRLIYDLDNNGPLFRQMLGGLNDTYNSSLHQANTLFQATDEAAELGVTWAEYNQQELTWQAMLINTCPDCLVRHGQTMTRSEWAIEGFPGSGQTVCGANCMCVLLSTGELERRGINPRDDLRLPVYQLAKESGKFEPKSVQKTVTDLTPKKLERLKNRAFKKTSDGSIVSRNLPMRRVLRKMGQANTELV